MKYILSISLFLLLSLTTLSQVVSKKQLDLNGFQYISYDNSPLDCRVYTLENGLTVFLNKNTNSPRIQTYIAVKAGSTYDPLDNTGLAHYLEHMMFKGTCKFGTINFIAEDSLLTAISNLYEQHKAIDDTAVKRLIYAQIDSLSLIASGYAIANEYDKMCDFIGAKNTNAYTSKEHTVYINEIPSNDLERFLMLEQERFSKLVLRLFHTELEAVYEEFNMRQDDDYSMAYYTLCENLYPSNPYGRMGIGKAEHLKNPSMAAIHEFWNNYYRPNNMALSFSGDIDFEKTIVLINNTFGKLETGVIPEHQKLPKPVLKKPVVKEVYGPNEEFLFQAYCTDGFSSPEMPVLHVLSRLLYNGTSGLINLNLNKAQKVLSVDAGYDVDRDLGMYIISASPRQGQSLKSLQKLIAEQIDKIKKGEFDENQIKSVIKNFRLEQMQNFETNSVAHDFVETYSRNMTWEQSLNFSYELENVTKKDIIAYAQKIFADNYVLVNKLTGENKNKVKVQKPKISPVSINRSDESAFLKEFKTIMPGKIEPEFVNFNELIRTEKLSDNVNLNYIKNNENEIFNLYYIIEKGSLHDSLLPLAINYLSYLGTSKYNPDQLAIELYNNALSFDVSTTEDLSYVQISGLQSDFEKGIEMLEQIISDAQINPVAYQNMVDGIIKSRQDAKLNKDIILRNALVSYGIYGARSPFTDKMSEKSLRELDPKILVDIIHSLFENKHEIFFYGTEDFAKVSGVIKKSHKCEVPSNQFVEKKYPYAPNENNVYFINYDMVQAGIILLSQMDTVDVKDFAVIDVFNNYFGTGMSSVLFQEIRESKALAYQVYAYVKKANKIHYNNFLVSYIGTSADKISTAVGALTDLLDSLPYSKNQFESSKQTILTQIETQRIIKENIYFTKLRNQKLGIETDYREGVYNAVGSMSFDQIQKFFDEKIKGRKFTYLVIGNKNDIDMSVLEKLGTVKELSLDEAFGY